MSRTAVRPQEEEYATELTDKWLFLMADVDPKKVRTGVVSKEESHWLVDAMMSLNKLPLYYRGC
ncbi:MAG: hypothetical protein H0T51_20005 [Pirellulales bacterium]|nr:hypothetical protein [Pirellulales bacterium]